MAFPTIPTTAASRLLSTTAPSTSTTRTFPDLSGLTKSAGDLLIALIVCYQSAGSSGAVFSGWSAGWTEFIDQMTTSGGTMAIGAAYKWSTGSETGQPSVTQASPTGHAAMFLMAIPGAHASSPPEAGTIADGTGAAADPGSFNPSWSAEDILWIAVGAFGETGTGGSFTAPSNAPTNYSDFATTALSQDAVGGVRGALGFRQLNADSEDVGTFTGVDTSNARNSALLIAVRPAAAGPQEFFITPSGSVTPTGALVKAVSKPLGGGITPTGALAAILVKVLSVAGSITPTGTLTRQTGKALGGSVTPTGALAKAVSRFYGGSIAPSGSLALGFARLFAGSITPSGSLTRQTGKALVGSITPSGALRKDASRFYGGAVSPNGALTKAVAKSLEGGVTPSGTLSTIVQKLLSLGGSIAPTGTLTNLVGKALSGSVTPGGTLTRQTGKALGGTITPSGTLTKAVSKFLAGTIGPTGTLTTFFQPGGGGAILMNFAGSITPSGELTKAVSRFFGGETTPTGTLSRGIGLVFSGSITPTGAVKKDVAKFLLGSITPTGTLALLANLPGAGVIGSVWGSVRQRFGLSGGTRGDQAAGGSRADGYASGGDRRSDE